jgi:hypothetical protein
MTSLYSDSGIHWFKVMQLDLEARVEGLAEEESLSSASGDTISRVA